MSSGKPLNSADCDFVIVRGKDGICLLEKWSLAGRLEDAMHAVVDDLFKGKVEHTDKAEFALGFIAAIDVLANGRLRLEQASDRSELAGTIERAWRSMHGAKPADQITTVMSDACAKIAKSVERGDAE